MQAMSVCMCMRLEYVGKYRQSLTAIIVHLQNWIFPGNCDVASKMVTPDALKSSVWPPLYILISENRMKNSLSVPEIYRGPF